MENKIRCKEVNVVFIVTLILYLAASYFISGMNLGLVAELLVCQLVILCPTLLYFLVRRIKFWELIRFHRMNLGTFFLVFLFAIVLQPVLTFLNAFSMLFVDYTISDSISAGTTTIPFLAMFATVALVPAFSEEMVYRGLYFHTYRKESIAKGAILCGLVFGMMHANFNQFAYAFVLGTVMALVVEATGTIFSSMLMHLIYNGYSVCLLYLLQFVQKRISSDGRLAELLESSMESAEDVITVRLVLGSLLIPAIICGVLAFSLFRVIAQRNHSYERIKQSFVGFRTQGRVTNMVSLPLIIGLLFLLYSMIMVEVMLS